MNKEQILKHGEIIKWLYDNPEKNLWQNNGNGWVESTEEISFNLNMKYVQNDEYSEFRKHLADDKHIIYKFGTWKKDGTDRWLTLKVKPTSMDYGNDFWDFEWKFAEDVAYNLIAVKNDEYRIKPDEPEFKVGDWVIYTCISAKYKKGFITQIEDLNIFRKWEGFKLWEPQEGKWCVFYGTKPTKTKYIVARYVKKKKGLYVAGYGGYNSAFTNIAPLAFINTLNDLD